MNHRGLMLFFRWWVRQLVSLVPPRLLQIALEAGEVAILEIADEGFVLNARRMGKAARVSEGALKDLKQAMEAAPDLPHLRFLRIPPEQVLRKKLSLPQAARRDIKTVLGFEIDRETPFEQREVYWTYRVAPSAVKGRLDIDLILVPRDVADALVQVVRENGFAPAALDVAGEDGHAPLIWLEAPNPLRYYRLPSKPKLPMAAVYGAVAFVIALPFLVQEVRFFLADRTISALEKQAHEASRLNLAANRRVAALAFMSGSHLGEGGPLEILAATTKALPDDSFLTSFSVHDGQVTMAGSSEAAAKLIGVLTASPSFRDPVFDSAVLESDDLEKFSISAKLVTPGIPAGAP